MSIEIHDSNRAAMTAEEISRAISKLPAHQRRQFLDKINAGTIEYVGAAEATEQKKVRLESVRAARAKARDDLSTRNALSQIDGMLRRFRLPGLESIAEAGPAKLDEILASSAPQKLSIEQRLLLKSWLHGLRLV